MVAPTFATARKLFTICMPGARPLPAFEVSPLGSGDAFAFPGFFFLTAFALLSLPR